MTAVIAAHRTAAAACALAASILPTVARDAWTLAHHAQIEQLAIEASRRACEMQPSEDLRDGRGGWCEVAIDRREWGAARTGHERLIRRLS